MTTQQYINKIKNATEELENGKFIYDCISTAHGQQVDRIFLLGEAADGSKIGTYSTKEIGIYVNPLTQSPVKFTPAGKKRGSGEKFKNGKVRKTRYFVNWKAYRRKIGRETAFVNLQNTTKLSVDYSNSLRIRGSKVVSSVHGKENIGKVKGAMKRYGGKRVWNLNKEERKQLRTCFLKKMQSLLS